RIWLAGRFFDRTTRYPALTVPVGKGQQHLRTSARRRPHVSRQTGCERPSPGGPAMSRFDGLLKLVLVSALAGCGFNPGEAGAPTGAGASSGSGTGAGGTTGVGASSGIGASPGIGLSSGAGGDVGIGGSSCGQTNVQVMPEPPDILI